MPVRCVVVPISDRVATRAAILQELGAALGLPVGTAGYAGMAAWSAPGVLAPPGVGETTQVCDERVSRDGTEVAFVLDDTTGAEIVLRHGFSGAAAMRMRAQAGRTVRGRPLPPAQVVPDNFFPDPPPSDVP